MGLGIDVGEDGSRAGVDHRLGGGEEADARYDHLVARADAKGPQGNRERLGAVRDPDAVAAADEGGELGLEGCHLRSQDVPSGLEYRALPSGDLADQRLECRPGGEQRHRADWSLRAAVADWGYRHGGRAFRLLRVACIA